MSKYDEKIGVLCLQIAYIPALKRRGFTLAPGKFWKQVGESGSQTGICVRFPPSQTDYSIRFKWWGKPYIAKSIYANPPVSNAFYACGEWLPAQLRRDRSTVEPTNGVRI